MELVIHVQEIIRQGQSVREREVKEGMMGKRGEKGRSKVKDRRKRRDGLL